MWLALVFAVVDLAGGAYLLRYAFSGRQRRPEPALVVGAVLVVAAVFLSVVAWQLRHRPSSSHQQPVPAGGVHASGIRVDTRLLDRDVRFAGHRGSAVKASAASSQEDRWSSSRQARRR